MTARQRTRLLYSIMAAAEAAAADDEFGAYYTLLGIYNEVLMRSVS